MASSNDPVGTPRRRQLIEAAGRLFRANGFRAVTMEAIAAEAGVAKATLYSNFPDKRAIFTAVADFVIGQIADALAAGLSSAGSVEERLLAGLTARHVAIFELVDGSAHARELMSARDAYARNAVDKVDAEMIEALATVLRQDPVFAKFAHTMSWTLFRGCIGVVGGARTIKEVETQIDNFVRPYLIGVRGLAEQGAAANMKMQDKSVPDTARRAAGGRK